MAGASVTLKMGPKEHQALQALLKFLARMVDETTFRAVLASQGGRILPEVPIDRVLRELADELISAVS